MIINIKVYFLEVIPLPLVSLFNRHRGNGKYICVALHRNLGLPSVIWRGSRDFVVLMDLDKNLVITLFNNFFVIPFRKINKGNNKSINCHKANFNLKLRRLFFSIIKMHLQSEIAQVIFSVTKTHLAKDVKLFAHFATIFYLSLGVTALRACCLEDPGSVCNAGP